MQIVDFVYRIKSSKRNHEEPISVIVDDGRSCTTYPKTERTQVDSKAHPGSLETSSDTPRTQTSMPKIQEKSPISNKTEIIQDETSENNQITSLTSKELSSIFDQISSAKTDSASLATSENGESKLEHTQRSARSSTTLSTLNWNSSGNQNLGTEV
uniref:Uncharacterized protein n=1 Tax=Acrobeloides nanus TaxID=290746 RepID=A0A914E290_9BILA